MTSWACYFNRGPMWTPSGPPARQDHSGFGVAELNCTWKFKNRPFWTTLSGFQCAACHVLSTLPALQQRPHVPFFEIVFMIYIYSISMRNFEAYVPSYRLWGRELGQQVYVHMFWLFSQGFLKSSRARRPLGVVTWHDFTWRGRGFHFPPSPPPPDLVVHVRAPLFAYVDVRYWWRATRWPHLVHGGLASPPSIDWVAHARYHSPIQFSILNYNFKSKCQNRFSK